MDRLGHLARPFGPFGFTHRSKTADASANVAVDEALLKSEEATEAAVAEAVEAGLAVAVGSKGPRGRQGMGDIRPPPPPHEDAFERVRGLIVNSGLSG